MCEIMYLMMAADGRVLNVERKVLRGALDVLSRGQVRTAHMEAMIDASSRRVAEYGAEKCLAMSIEALAGDAIRAETTLLLAAAVAAADGTVTQEEEDLLDEIARRLEMSEGRAGTLLEELLQGL